MDAGAYYENRSKMPTQNPAGYLGVFGLWHGAAGNIAYADGGVRTATKNAITTVGAYNFVYGLASI